MDLAVNTTSIPDDEARRLIRFAARGTRDSRVEVHLKDARHVYKGLAYNHVPDHLRQRERSRYLVRLWVGVESRFPYIARSHLKRITAKWPDGLPLENRADALVFLAAHEFRHIWYFLRGRRPGEKKKRGEYDAERFAARRLSEWRVETGRSPILEVKLKDPFAALKIAATSSREPRG